MRPAYRRLSDSPLWRAQRRFYASAGIRAWRTGTVPHQVTNSVALAEAYARVVGAFARDRRSREPLHVVELGAGAGRFAFLFLQALDRLAPAAATIRYVMTDVAADTIEFWRGHPAFAPFRSTRRLDVAEFEAGRHATICLAGAQREITPVTPVDRLVVIANYVFSGLPQDAFVYRGGRAREWLVTVRAQGHRPDAVLLKGRPGAPVIAPYEEEECSVVLSNTPSPRGLRLFPIGALRTLRALTTLVRRDALVLVADRPDPGTALDGTALGMGRHGAISFPVDITALHAWATARGGTVLSSRHRARHLAITGLLLGTHPDGWAKTKAAWREAMARGGPDALYHRRRKLATSRRPALGSLLALLRASGNDPRVVAECLRPLWPHLTDASPALRRELRDIATAAWRNHYELGEPHDVAFDLGLLLYGVRAWDDARGLFEASLRSHGGDAAAWWNLGLCHVALGTGQAARRAFRTARELAPQLNVAGPVTVKAGCVRARPPSR